MNTTSHKLRSAEISLIEEDIVQIITAANYETTIEDVDEINDAIKALLGDKPYFILVLPQHGSTSTNEAKEYAARKSVRNNIIAEAIVIPNIAIRMMAVAYMKINRPHQKIKLFNTKEKALRWLHLVRLKARV